MVANVDSGDAAWVRVLARSTLVVTGVGCAALAVALYVPGLTSQWLMELVGRIPLLGMVGVQLLAALHAYRNRKVYVLGALSLSLVVGATFVLSFFLIARGLPMRVPTIVEHYFIVPLGLVAGSIPVTPNGLGTFEAAINALYQIVPSGADVLEGTGTLATLAHRVAMMAVGAVGVLFYVSQRGEMLARRNAVEQQ